MHKKLLFYDLGNENRQPNWYQVVWCAGMCKTQVKTEQFAEAIMSMEQVLMGTNSRE